MSKKYQRKPKAILLDIDDTICSFLDTLCRVHNKMNGTCIYPTDFHEYDFEDIDFTDINGNRVVGSELRKTFIDFEDHGIYTALKPLPDAKHALHLMRKLGYKIILITARKSQYERQTLFNLINEDLEYDDIVFCPSEEKAKNIRRLGREYNIAAFADDKLSTVIDVFENTSVKKTYIVNKAHNINKEVDEDIKRINSIFEIVRDLKDVT